MLENLNENWIYTLTAPIVAAIIGIVTIWHSRKQHNRIAMIDIFSMLNKDTDQGNHKLSQELIFIAHKENRLYNLDAVVDAYKGSANIISRNYDEIGLLSNRRLMPRKDFFYMYGKLVVVSHFILFQSIKHRREVQNESDYMANFTKLAIDCYFYWKNKKRLPRDPKTNKEIDESVVKEWKKSLPK